MPEEKRSTNWMKDVVLPLAVLIVGGALSALALKYADLPTKIAVIDNRVSAVEGGMARFDDKLDRILARLPRR